jgi:phosphoglycerate dehydrogenase-like enzyme
VSAPAVLIAPPVYRDRRVPYFRPLQEAGLELRFNDLGRRLEEDELIARLDGVVATVAASEPYTERVFAAAPKLRCVARFGVGFDAVDVAAASRHGVAVAMAFGANHEAVADYALAHMLAQATRLLPHHATVLEGRWGGGLHGGLWRRTVGILGLGRIGRAVARRLKGFECRLLAHDTAPDPAAAATLGVELVGLDTLLAEAEILTVHLPRSPATTGLLGAAELARMRPGAVLVNTARGGIVDETALAAALASGRLAGAGLDVFANEPLEPGSPLRGLATVSLSPHVAGLDLTSERLVAERCTASILAVLAGRDPGPGLLLDRAVLRRS